MANLMSTHAHDYRWPTSHCLTPKAEIPNGDCEIRPAYSGKVDKPWCQWDPPSAQPPASSARTRAPECNDIENPSTKRPWCERGILVTHINPPATAGSAKLKLRPDGCTEGSQVPARPWCDGGPPVISARVRTAPQPDTSRYGQPNQCLKKCQCNSPAQPPRTLPRECYDIVDTANKHQWRPDTYTEGPQVPARSWCNGGPPVVSARVGAAPQQDTSRYDQPNQYLEKLCDKYPRPTAVVTATPRDELMRRVYADRYRTTYQSDYCRNSDDTARLIGQCDTYDPDHRSTVAYDQRRMNGHVPQFEEEYATCKCGCGCRVRAQRSVAQQTVGQQTVGQQTVGQQCVTQQSVGQGEPMLSPLACRPAPVSQNFHFSCCTPKKNLYTSKGSSGGSRGGSRDTEHVGPPEKLPPWASEYTDGIGRTGKLIMEQKLHSQKPRKVHF